MKRLTSRQICPNRIPFQSILPVPSPPCNRVISHCFLPAPPIQPRNDLLQFANASRPTEHKSCRFPVFPRPLAFTRCRKAVISSGGLRLQVEILLGISCSKVVDNTTKHVSSESQWNRVSQLGRTSPKSSCKIRDFPLKSSRPAEQPLTRRNSEISHARRSGRRSKSCRLKKKSSPL